MSQRVLLLISVRTDMTEEQVVTDVQAVLDQQIGQYRPTVSLLEDTFQNAEEDGDETHEEWYQRLRRTVDLYEERVTDDVVPGRWVEDDDIDSQSRGLC